MIKIKQKKEFDKNILLTIPLHRERFKLFRMNTIFKFLLCSIFFLHFISAKAQNTLSLSLDSSIVYALNHNKTLINSKYAISKSSQKIKETIAAGLPQINASIDYSNFLGATAELKLSDKAPAAVIEFNPTSNFKANVSQVIFNGNLFIGIQLSKLAKSITEQSYQKDELNVKEQTTQAYYMILASERILKIVKGNRENIQLIFEKTTNLVNAGIIEETEAKKLTILITTVDNSTKSIERQLEMGYNLLRLQLGIESNQEIKLTTTLDEIELKHFAQSSISDTFNIENNIDFNLVSMQGKIAKKQITMKQSNYLPTLVAFYSYTEKIIKPVFDMTPKQVLGFTLNIPIFSGGQRLYQVSQAKIDYKITQNTEELLKQQLTTQERQLRYNYNNLLEQYINQKANLEISKEVLDKMTLKFQQGIISSLELTSANNEYLNAESNYTNVLLQLLNANLSLRKINNKL